MVDEARGFTFITQGAGEAQRAMQSCSPYAQVYNAEGEQGEAMCRG